MTRQLAALALALASGCASNAKPAAPPSDVALQAAALEANRKGETYVRHGELESAARSFAEALRLSQSLEDAEGIAANAVNLSIVRQRQGRFSDARAALGAVSEQRNLRFTPVRQAEAALRYALLDLDERKFDAAQDWVAKAAGQCAGRCPLAGAILNVRAQLALQTGQVDAAANSARAALDASRSAGDRPETANALRILGVAALRSGNPAAARQQLEQALAIDRELGAPRKIAFDLLALGRAAALAGDREGARSFYTRALSVSEADRDAVAAAEARALLEAVDKAATGK
jgi:tetratricopeptide (TPR) repeat protein